jgi:aminotransferase
MLDRLAQVAYQGPHQYSVTFGAQNFREAIARKEGRSFGRPVDPATEVVVTCGGTEAMMCAMMTVCNPGDKVLVFSPFYENYGADAILSGAEPIYIPLVPPAYSFDRRALEDGFRRAPRRSFSAIPPIPAARCSRARSWSSSVRWH